MLLFGVGLFMGIFLVMTCMSFMKISASSDITAAKLFENAG